jgi:hypothetical protein
MSASRRSVSSRWALLGLAAVLLAAAPAVPQTPSRPGTTRPAPRVEPVAETRLLMDGLTRANFRGLERVLQDVREKPADLEAWTHARGQALLIGETANLLMLRPPHNQGQDTWMERCRDLREAATTLARHAANQDYGRCRADLRDLANTCNRCHQTFRVNVRVAPEGEAPGRDAGER